MKIPFYPLQFYPIFKERLWGGDKLKTVLNKPIDSNQTGESWELSTVEGAISTVANGVFEGQSITSILAEFPNEILGTTVCERFGNQFPLLFKFLDAKEDLSVQVHPNDALAKQRHNSFGKTEMWYVIQAEPGARLISGFKETIDVSTYLNHIKNNTLLTSLDEIVVNQGDAFFIETGTVHAIGAGMLVAEIQQTSDITYRLYDFDRVDANGNLRELHVDLALEAINFNTISSKKQYQINTNQSNQVVDCTYFTTHFIALDGEIEVVKTGATFTVFMCVEGSFEMTVLGQKYTYSKGDTILVPAVLTQFQLSGKASILEIYIS
jgi:mannose-6-phosphate isomerase